VGRVGGLVITGVSNMAGYPEVLKQYAKQMGVQDRVFISGRFLPTERAQWYQACDVFLFPGDCLNEAFGQTTVESLACGIPIIQSAWDGLKDTLTAEAGTLIPTYAAPVPERIENLSVAIEAPNQFLALAQSTVIDRKAWFDAHDFWFTNEQARQEASQKARDLFEFKFEPAILEKELVQILSSCLEAATTKRSTSSTQSHSTLQVDYTRMMSHYVSVGWNDNFVFSETQKGKEWRAGGGAPYIYQELEPILDLELLATIQERVAAGSVSSHKLSHALETNFSTPKDVVFHAMFLTKHGYLSLDPSFSHS